MKSYWKKLTLAGGVISSALLVSIIISCSKDDAEQTSDNKEYVLVIKNGAQTILPDASISYSANLIDNDGNISTPENVSWSTSDNSIAGISTMGVLSVAGIGNVKITATVTKNGKTLTAFVPLGIYAASAFTVAPSAIIYEQGCTLQLETFQLSTSGAGSPNCNYTSNNTAIATVSNTGLVNFVSAGECIITVTATSIQGSPVVTVPVIVIGVPTIELPVTRIDVNPPAKDLFKNENQQLTAKAYKSDGSETSVNFTWISLNNGIATVSNSGYVQPVATGTTYIQASANGITGQAQIIVNSDTLVVIEPFYTSFAAGTSKQFSATAYYITRTNATPYTGITFDWEIPTYGFSIFDIATVNNSGLVTMKQDATPGMMTFVMAKDHNNQWVGGVGTILVAIADDCDCGSGNPEVNHITISNSSPINLTVIGGAFQLDVKAYNQSNIEVSSPNLVFCSDNIAVANVDSNGEIVPTGQGSATIKVCSGTYAEATITVNVTLMK